VKLHDHVEICYHMTFQMISRHTIPDVSLEWPVKHQMTMLTIVWELTNMYKQLTFKSRPKAVFALDLKPPPSSLPLIEGSCCLCPFPSAEGWYIDSMFPQYSFRFVLFYNSFSLGDHVDHWDVWVLVMSTSFPLLLGIMWIIGMCECLSWVLPFLKMQEVDMWSVGELLASLGRYLPNLPASKVSQRWTMWVRWVVRGRINSTLP